MRLARLKFLRGTASTPSGRSEERRTDARLIGEYLELVDRLLHVTPTAMRWQYLPGQIETRPCQNGTWQRRADWPNWRSGAREPTTRPERAGRPPQHNRTHPEKWNLLQHEPRTCVFFASRLQRGRQPRHGQRGRQQWPLLTSRPNSDSYWTGPTTAFPYGDRGRRLGLRSADQPGDRRHARARPRPDSRRLASNPRATACRATLTLTLGGAPNFAPGPARTFDRAPIEWPECVDPRVAALTVNFSGMLLPPVFISSAFAQTAPQVYATSTLMNMLPMVLMFVVLYPSSP